MNSEKEKERELLANIKAKSDDDYEKNITYIAAGTLVLSLTFIEKIVSINKSHSVWTIIVSWSILVLTLLTNLISHQLSSIFHEKTIDDFDNGVSNLNENIVVRNRIIRNVNWLSTFLLITGLIFLILFCSKSLIKMAEENSDLRNLNDSSYIEKGRAITAPATSNSGAATSSSNNPEQSSSKGLDTSSSVKGNGNSSDSIKK